MFSILLLFHSPHTPISTPTSFLPTIQQKQTTQPTAPPKTGASSFSRKIQVLCNITNVKMAAHHPLQNEKEKKHGLLSFLALFLVGGGLD
jgi:hypothetical protein